MVKKFILVCRSVKINMKRQMINITSDHQEYPHTQYHIFAVSDLEVQTVFRITDIALSQYSG